MLEFITNLLFGNPAITLGVGAVGFFGLIFMPFVIHRFVLSWWWMVVPALMLLWGIAYVFILALVMRGMH